MPYFYLKPKSKKIKNLDYNYIFWWYNLPCEISYIYIKYELKIKLCTVLFIKNR